MKYYYNETENSFFIATNFEPQGLTPDWEEITKEQYEDMNPAKEQETQEESQNDIF